MNTELYKSNTLLYILNTIKYNSNTLLYILNTIKYISNTLLYFLNTAFLKPNINSENPNTFFYQSITNP
jgi:hypothetical protein